MKLFSSYILSLLLLSGFFIDDTGDKRHLITVNHPAFGKDDPNQFYLEELRQDSNSLEGYFLDAESVICVDHSCKIVPVRMFWDPLGNYQKYELEKGVILEKKEGKPFLPEDYERLHEILQDNSSPFSGLTYYEITHEKVIGEGDVDGMSGATAILLDEEKTVLGGAWTCYTLWHWAHGETVQEIQRITGAAASVEELKLHLMSYENQRQIFALNELIKREEVDPTIVAHVIKLGQDSKINSKIFKKVLDYLEQAEAEIYHRNIKQLLIHNSADRRKLLWNSLMTFPMHPPVNYFDRIIKHVLDSKDYQEMDLFLNILQQKKATTPFVTHQLIPLLKEEFSILSRRVYWFLSQQKLTDSQTSVLQTYYKRYSDYL